MKESSSTNTLKLTIIKKITEVKAGEILNTCQEGQLLFLLCS